MSFRCRSVKKAFFHVALCEKGRFFPSGARKILHHVFWFPGTEVVIAWKRTVRGVQKVCRDPWGAALALERGRAKFGCHTKKRRAERGKFFLGHFWIFICILDSGKGAIKNGEVELNIGSLWRCYFLKDIWPSSLAKNPHFAPLWTTERSEEKFLGT